MRQFSSLVKSKWVITTCAVAFLGQSAAMGYVDRVIVSLPDQAFAAFSGGELVLRGPISSGRGGYETRTGVFRVSNKHRDWTSTIYGVPMPNFLRLNGGSMGLHGGYLPGFAASHGCVRLTYADAAKLFEIASVGTQVVITGNSTEATRGVKQPRTRAIYYRVVNGRRVILSDDEVRRITEIRAGRHTWMGTKYR